MSDARDATRSTPSRSSSVGTASTGHTPAFMDLVSEQYGWGDHAQARFDQRLKDALDPHGILAPGKQGIWPSEVPARG